MILHHESRAITEGDEIVIRSIYEALRFRYEGDIGWNIAIAIFLKEDNLQLVKDEEYEEESD